MEIWIGHNVSSGGRSPELKAVVLVVHDVSFVCYLIPLFPEGFFYRQPFL